MPEILDIYEDKWGDYGEGNRPGSHLQIHHRKKLPKEVNPIVPEQKQTKEEISRESETLILKHLKGRWGRLPLEERAEAVTKYLEWVKSSLDAGYAILDDEDIKTKEDERFVRMTHGPSLISSKAGNQIESKALLFERLSDHFKIWKSTSEDFKGSLLYPCLVASAPPMESFVDLL